jgi:hypothetical protein
MNNDTLTINLIRDKYGDEFIKLKPRDMKWNQYYGYLHDYYTTGKNGKKHYWDEEIQKQPIIARLYETNIPEMWLEKYGKYDDKEGASFAVINNNFKVVNWLADRMIFP